MNTKREVEIFSAGCAACIEVIELVERIVCPSCHVTIRDMHNADVITRARQLGITRVPSVTINGKLATCCTSVGATEETLRAAGLGVSLSEENQ